MEARAALLHAGQVPMPQHRSDGWETAVQVEDELPHRLLLRRCASVGYATVLVESTLVADAYRVPIVSLGMRPHALYRATRVNHTVERDVIMVAYVAPMVHHHVVVAQLLQGISAIAASCAAMHHYHVDFSHSA